MEAAGVGGEVFRLGAGIFSAVERTEGINLTQGLAISIVAKPGADIGELAAGAATNTLAVTGLIDR
ncbi:MAG: hypothetical protein ABSG82_05365 [Sedimentisphaerales bacterium]